MKTALAGFVSALFLMPALAQADGLPVTGLDGRAGVLSNDGAYRTVTFISRRDTIVARIHTNSGQVARYRLIPGQLAVPAVAYDLSVAGLSADGHTLALIRPRRQIHEPHTRITVLDAQRLLLEKTIVLSGDFSLDAISPDGSKLYLVEYLALTPHNFDPTKYAVRSLDTRTGRLDPAPIVDAHEPGEKMGGLPVTRATSSDGRWAYTLYSGSEHPFIHALDTVAGTARCVDLDALTARSDIFQMRLRLAAGGRQLRVVKDEKPVAFVDSRSFHVSSARPAAAHQPAGTAAKDGGSRTWPFVVAAGLLVLLIATTARPLARATRAR